MYIMSKAISSLLIVLNFFLATVSSKNVFFFQIAEYFKTKTILY